MLKFLSCSFLALFLASLVMLGCSIADLQKAEKSAGQVLAAGAPIADQVPGYGHTIATGMSALSTFLLWLSTRSGSATSTAATQAVAHAKTAADNAAQVLAHLRALGDAATLGRAGGNAAGNLLPATRAAT